MTKMRGCKQLIVYIGKILTLILFTSKNATAERGLLFSGALSGSVYGLRVRQVDGTPPTLKEDLASATTGLRAATGALGRTAGQCYGV